MQRGFLRYDKELRAGNFAIRNQLIGNDLEGKVLGIIGTGRIGRLVAKKAVAGLDMKALGFDPYANVSKIDNIEMLSSMEELLKRSDFVTLHRMLLIKHKLIPSCALRDLHFHFPAYGTVVIMKYKNHHGIELFRSLFQIKIIHPVKDHPFLIFLA